MSDRNGSSCRLELSGLAKSFGRVRAVDGVDLTVEPGELFTLLGPSGSGKTTILRLIAGFERPDAGRVIVDGRDISPLSPAERNVGVVFQNYALFPHMTVADNVGYPLRLRRVGRRERRERVARILSLVRIDGLERRRPAELSGGQQQRVAVARALVFSPRVLLMDEPLGALDRSLRLELEEELRRIHRETGVTIVYVTHDQEEALILSDRVGILRAGKLLQQGTPMELFESPRDAFVARFFGDCNLLPIAVAAENGDLRWTLGANGSQIARRWRWGSPDGGVDGRRWYLMVRTTRMRLAGWHGPADDGVVSISGAVEDVVYLGQRIRIQCATPEVGTVLAETDARAARGIRPGERIRLAFDVGDATLVPEEASAGTP